jgi:hypothetical protein
MQTSNNVCNGSIPDISSSFAMRCLQDQRSLLAGSG